MVCGPIYLNQQHRKIGKNKVVVPEAFFKVVLRMGDYPQAIGFICRNQSQKGRKRQTLSILSMKLSELQAMISSLNCLII